MIYLLLLLMAAADVSSVKTEPDLEKRSELALNSAEHDMDLARQAYEAGDMKKMREALEDLRGSVTLCSESLEPTQNRAHGSRYYKRAELRTRALTRRLMGLADEVGVDDRPPVEETRQRVAEVHDQLLAAILSKKKK